MAVINLSQRSTVFFYVWFFLRDGFLTTKSESDQSYDECLYVISKCKFMAFLLFYVTTYIQRLHQNSASTG